MALRCLTATPINGGGVLEALSSAFPSAVVVSSPGPDDYWAWCTVAVPLAEIPDGVSQVGNALYFFKRNGQDGGAEFDFSAVAGHGIVDDTIYFIDGPINVHGLEVPETADVRLVFTCTNSATTLRPTRLSSVFTVEAEPGEVRRFVDLRFESGLEVPPETWTLDGCAINVVGGGLEVVNCEFEGCAAQELGGAICAVKMDGNMTVTGSTFTACSVYEGNGYGGAIHATAAADAPADVRFTVVDSAFSGNTAGAGGAISTAVVGTYGGEEEREFALDLKNDRFADNSSFWEGGAIWAGGDLVIAAAADAGATVFQDNRGGYMGGAIYVGDGVDRTRTTMVEIGPGALFVGNSVSNDVYYTEAGGGAIMVQSDKPVAFAADGATFKDNAAWMPYDEAWSTYADGGAIYFNFSPDAIATFTNVTFVGNRAVAADESSGGAVSSRGTPLEILGCTFEGNVADDRGFDFGGGLGGAVYVIAVDASIAVMVDDTTFVDNRATLEGGAIRAGTADNEDVRLTVTVLSDSAFRGNTAANDRTGEDQWTCGGAVTASSNVTFEVTGRHVIFEENSAASEVRSYGGAVYLAEGSDAFIELAGFLANGAKDAGGAVFATGADPTVSTCIFSNNTVSVSGGVGGAFAAEAATVILSNCTVRGSNGWAVDFYETDAKVINCVVADNCGETDISSRTDVGSSATLLLSYSSYGTVEASETVAVTTNACFSGTGASVYRGTTLYLDSLTRYLPEAAEGLVQEAWDYDAVKYGSRPEGTSMGAYECPTPPDDPKVEIVEVVWYHCRSMGLYYPRITVRYIEGDATRIQGLTLTCEGADHELPESCVAELRTATVPGQEFTFGVNPETFVQYPNSSERWGFVPNEDRLFGVHGATRPIGFSVDVKGTLRFSEVKPVAAVTRLMASALKRVRVSGAPGYVSSGIPAKICEFTVGARLSGRVETVSGARIRIYGCAALGGEWVTVDELNVNAAGRFETAVPEGLFFFKVEVLP